MERTSGEHGRRSSPRRTGREQNPLGYSGPQSVAMEAGVIGLLQVDGKWPNLALMHLGAWLRERGEAVVRISSIEQDICNIVYAAKVFQFTAANYVHDDAIRGGTGWPDWESLPALTPEQEHTYPAYDLFECQWAMGFLTRGCIRHCPYCVVPRKEGRIRHHAHLSEWWRGQKYIRLLDPNITSHPDVLGYLEELAASGAQVDFSQGLDARLVTPEIAQAIARVRLWDAVHTAWDSLAQEERTIRGITMLRDALPSGKLMAYVLIGFDTTEEQDLYRVMKLRELGVDPFVMPFDRRNPYQRRFARWVNHKAIFKSVSWAEYAPSLRRSPRPKSLPSLGPCPRSMSTSAKSEQIALPEPR